MFARTYSGPGSWFASTPDHVAAVIVRAIAARRPKSRYLVNPTARSLVAMKRWLPDRAHDAFVRRVFQLPR